MKSKSVKSLFKLLYSLSFLALSVLCNAYSYQYNISSQDASFVKQSCLSDINKSDAYLMNDDEPSNNSTIWWSDVINEIIEIEEDTDNSEANNLLGLSYFFRFAAIASYLDFKRFPVTQAFQHPTVKKFILFHRLKLDC